MQLTVSRSSNARNVSVIILAAFVLMTPGLLLGAGGSDLRTQVLWVKYFSDQFWQGDLYPRWLQGMYAGDGSPTFFYYPPLAYLLTALFAPLAGLDDFGFYPIAASSLVAVALAGVTFYCWMRDEGLSSTSAVIGSLVYMAAPEHLGMDFYQLMLLSSGWVYVWVPLLMLFARRLGRNVPLSLPAFATLLFLLIITNIPNTVIFGPVCALYALVQSPKERLWVTAGRLASATALAFTLAAFYLLPAIVYAKYVNIGVWNDALGTDKFFFLSSKVSRLRWLYYWIAFAALIPLYFYALPVKRPYWFLPTVAGAALFMMTPLSEIVWNIISVFRQVQFAERWFAVPAFALAALVSRSAPRLRHLNYVLIAAFGCVTLFIGATTRYSMNDLKTYYVPEYVALKYGIDQYGAFMTSMDLLNRYGTAQGLREVLANREKIQLVGGDASFEVLAWEPRFIAFSYKSATPAVFRVRQFFFPLMEARIGDAVIPIKREDRSGETLIEAPAGTGEIDVRLTEQWPESAGKKLSLMGIGIVTVVLLVRAKSRKTVSASRET